MRPSKFFAYADAYHATVRWENYRFGILSWLIRSAFGVKDAEPMDFFEEKKPVVRNPRDFAENMKALAAVQRQIRRQAGGKK